ncbi:MAG: hypothetical protein U0R70_16150 [Solirubrobacteraceae bacterium]
MTAFRLLSLPAHGAVELLTGLAAMAGALALGLGPAGTVLGFAAGAVAFGLALAAADGSMRSSLHATLDHTLAAGAIAAGALLATAGDPLAAGLLVAFGVVQIGLASVTRYAKR